jgi:hypothetical protein
MSSPLTEAQLLKAVPSETGATNSSDLAWEQFVTANVLNRLAGAGADEIWGLAVSRRTDCDRLIRAPTTGFDWVGGDRALILHERARIGDQV